MVSWSGGMRWAYSARGWMGFFFSLPDGRVVLRHELTWLKTAPEDAARDILAFCVEHEIPSLTHVAANPDLWPSPNDSSETISQTFTHNGVPLKKGTEDTVNGWSRVRSWLAPRRWKDAEGQEFSSPSLLIHPDCKYFLRTFPTLVSDDKHPDEIADSTDQYPAEGLMFYAMSRPVPWMPKPKPEPGPGTWGYELRHVLRPEIGSRGRVLGA